MSESHTYVPYEATAHYLVGADPGFETFVRSLFPDTDKQQMATLKSFVAGRVLEGIDCGLGLNCDDPGSSAEEYVRGYVQGRQDAQSHCTRNKRGEM